MEAKKRRKRLPQGERRKEILVAAGQMFRAVGYDAASIDAIAASVGVSGPAIYRYFSRKPEIMIALLEGAVATAIVAIDGAADGGGDILSAIADAMINHATREGAVIGLLQSGMAQMEADDRDRLHGFRLDLVGHLGAALRQARPKLSEAVALLHADAALGIVGHVSPALANNPTLAEPFGRMVRAVMMA